MTLDAIRKADAEWEPRCWCGALETDRCHRMRPSNWHTYDPAADTSPEAHRRLLLAMVDAKDAALDELMSLRMEHGDNCYVAEDVGCICGMDAALERIYGCPAGPRRHRAPAMTLGWRHTQEAHVRVYDVLVCAADGCGCTDPRPDPESPCGFCGMVADDAHEWWTEPKDASDPGAYCAHDPRPGCHPYIPTLCLTCGHGLEPRP